MSHRTKAGAALAAKAKRESWSAWEAVAQFTIPEIEDEAYRMGLSDAEAALRRAVPEAGSREGLRAAADEFVEAVQSYLDPENQFTYSRRRHLDRTMAALVAAVDADDRAALGDTQEPRPHPLDVERLARALHVNTEANPRPYESCPQTISGWHRKSAEEIAREYAAASPAAPKEDDHG